MPSKDRQDLDKKSLRNPFQVFIPWLYVVAGSIAVGASTALSVEVFNRLKNPAFVPVCNLNPILSCTSVSDSSQAHIFGFPNYFIGIAGYAAVLTVGLVLLSGAILARWFWRLMNLCLFLAVTFVTWLQFETLYRIGALCIFCMVVWACTIPLFWYTLLYGLDMEHLPAPRRLRPVILFARKYHLEILIVWFLIIIILILKRFWYYWHTLI